MKFRVLAPTEIDGGYGPSPAYEDRGEIRARNRAAAARALVKNGWTPDQEVVLVPEREMKRVRLVEPK